MLAGEEDPVGAWRKGPRQVAQWLKETGHPKAELVLYPGMRHEILNERGKEQVWEKVLAFLQSL